MPKNRVCYFHDAETIGSFYYGPGHPMKPHRLQMTHNLILSYQLYKKMEVYRPHLATEEEMTQFHAADYIDFIKRVTPDNQHEFAKQLQKFTVGDDCPVFDGLHDYCRVYTGGSIDGAKKLNHGLTDVAINWSGGLHHAKRSEASGFCYVNDIVLAILELLKHHARVLYLDIDIHHGDGVEEAFYTTDRVMTVSFHKFGDYFPGTGGLEDIGYDKGKLYSLNCPLKDGIDDESYEQLFKPIMTKVMERYDPDAIVFQSGADSLSGDRLGCFNLSIKGHAECLKFMTTFGKPMLVLGGGGYTIRNVARCWAYETGCLLNVDLEDNLPQNDYIEYFGPEYRLHFTPSNMENQNEREYLEKVRNKILQNLELIEPAPNVPFHNVPSDALEVDERPDADLLDDDERGEGGAGDEKKKLWAGEVDGSYGEGEKPNRNVSDIEPSKRSSRNKMNGVEENGAGDKEAEEATPMDEGKG